MAEPSDQSDVASADALYDDAPCGLLLTSADGTILQVNKTFCVWLGVAAVDLVGRKRVQDVLTVGGRIFHHTHWGPLMQIQGSVAEVKLEVMHSDGRKLPMVWNAVRRFRNGVATDEVATFIAQDRHQYEQELLHARRRAEELLARAQEVQEQLAATQADRDRQRALAEDRALFAEQTVAIVSHDLRNPLSVIRMNAHILSMSGLTPQQQLALARLVRSNERATRLISDLLDFSLSRLGNGLQVELGEIDLHALVREAVEDLRIANPDHGIEHRKVGSGACRGSSDRLTQLLGNLVVNAITYGAPERPVVVATIIEPEQFHICVHNDGAPIPESLLPTLFDPMIRGATAGGHAGNVGLGLFIVREIARAHAAQVLVQSTEAEGTTFRVSFPR